MKCQKCGKEITEIEVNVFDCFGSDSFIKKQVDEIAEYGIAEFETDSNWSGYELEGDEQISTIRCPHCHEYPFKYKEVDVYNIVRVVMFE